MPGISDAIKREAAWLTSSGDGLPALLQVDGGPFKVVQARMPRTPPTRAAGLYLLPGNYTDDRWANQRKLATYSFRAAIYWPLGTTTVTANIAELEQDALDDAIGLVVERVRGLLGDHTHGGRFLAVAEAPARTEITVHYMPVENTAVDGLLRADVMWQAQDEAFI
ncbi:Hypothetical protein AJAP_42415 (plasmid) [Amycolatopsis japonica]|uniref:Uncharacterized protein n=1 Tax=Amycolatopsis japonica TaxID=208439 RepID=A0A075V9P6_9PSEU|nr:hypothetical protein [Amycolatopsis japonica]AIG81254.1 Hypothetical protein AJAP_42415 [Amycolatopsis japonica]